jgi:hypothetical protein
MSQCEALTLKGKKCSRQAEPGSEFCWQHQKVSPKPKKEVKKKKVSPKEVEKKKVSPKPKKEVKKKKKVSEPKKKVEFPRVSGFSYKTVSKKKEEPLCDPWLTCGKKMVTTDGWEVYEIPVGTILYKGVKSEFPDGDIKTIYPSWFASLETAFKYAFQKIKGENGKVITCVVKEPFRVLDMKSKNNFKLIHDRGIAIDVPVDVGTYRFIEGRKKGTEESVLEYGFGYNPRQVSTPKRQSNIYYDLSLAEWLCKKNLDGIIGWGHEKMGIQGKKGLFHDEIMVCDVAKYLKRYGIEYRFQNENPRVVLITKNGKVVDSIPSDKFYPDASVYFSSGVIYEPDPNKQSDTWLIKKKVKTKINKY